MPTPLRRSRFHSPVFLAAIVAILATAAQPLVAAETEPTLAELQARIEAGDLDAQVRLGNWTYYGREDAGVAKNVPEALRLLRDAAERGNAKAQLRLGALYGRSDADLPADLAESFRWYMKAAAQNEADGQYSVGILYLEGVGVPKDRAKAITWLQRAADQGEKYSRMKLDELGLAPATSPGPNTNPPADPNLAKLTPALKQFAASVALAADQVGRERAVARFSSDIAAVRLQLTYSDAELSDFVARRLQPVMERFPNEAGAYTLQFDGIDGGAFPRVLPPQLYDYIRHYGLAVMDDLRAQHKFELSLGALLTEAKGGNSVAQVLVAQRYAAEAKDLHAETFRRRAAYWYRQARKQGNNDATAPLNQLTQTWRDQLGAAMKARDGGAAAAACEALGESGDAAMAREAGFFYLHGTVGAAQSEKKAAANFRRAAEAGDADAGLWAELLESKLGSVERGARALANGDAVYARENAESGFEKSERWFKYAQSQGDPAAEARLKDIERRNEAARLAKIPGSGEFQTAMTAFNAKDFAKARELFTVAADKGLAEAMANLAVIYEQGLGVPASLASTREWLAKAVAKNPALYQARLKEIDDVIAKGGFECERGIAAYQASDLPKARTLWTDAAGKGSPRAAYFLGFLSAQTTDQPRDLLAARRWYVKALTAGVTEAAESLQELEAVIANGGVELDAGYVAYQAQNFAEAFAQWKKAAEKKNVDATFNLGVMLRDGSGMAVDKAAAIEWFEKAAALGHKDALVEANALRVLP